MGTFSVDPLSEFNLKHIVPIEVAARIAHHHQLNIGCCGGNMALRSCTQTVMLRCALIVTCLFIATALAGPQEERRPKISDEQLERALNDKRYLQRQLKCALGEATCDPVGRRLKTLAPLVLRGSCPQCTPDEMRQIQRTLSHIQRNYPKEWNKIVKQYAAGF